MQAQRPVTRRCSDPGDLGRGHGRRGRPSRGYMAHAEGVDAVAQVRGCGVALTGEDVAEMTVAPCAADLSAHHAQAAVLDLGDCRGHRRIERRPSAMRSELRLRIEQGRSTAPAVVGARIGGVDVLTGPGRFGSGLAQNLVLLRRQDRAPLVVTETDHVRLAFKSTDVLVRLPALCVIHPYTLGVASLARPFTPPRLIGGSPIGGLSVTRTVGVAVEVPDECCCAVDARFLGR